MYEWRRMTEAEKEMVRKARREKRYPWHSPPHQIGDMLYYHVTAACYEHKHYIGYSADRLASFSEILVRTFTQAQADIYAWCVLPNHYHVLVKVDDFAQLIKETGRMHGRTAFYWNREEKRRGRKVWCNCYDRYIRGERHFWATMNYIHHNPVHHNYVAKWQDWPFSSAIEFMEAFDMAQISRIWNTYPILNYGKGWDI